MALDKACRDKVINYVQCAISSLAVSLSHNLDIGGNEILCKLNKIKELSIYLDILYSYKPANSSNCLTEVEVVKVIDAAYCSIKTDC